MQMNRILSFITSAAALVVLATSVSSAHAAAKPNPRVELAVTGPIFTLPDYTANGAFAQCRSSGLNSSGFSQRKTTLDLNALGLGTLRRIVDLEIGQGGAVTFGMWTSKNCFLYVNGAVVSGQWPLLAGSPGPELVIVIPRTAPWTFSSFGKTGGECRGTFYLPSVVTEDVVIRIRRNDARTINVCDCPDDYLDADENMIADACE
jgi:hypothetical protein